MLARHTRVRSDDRVPSRPRKRDFTLITDRTLYLTHFFTKCLTFRAMVTLEKKVIKTLHRVRQAGQSREEPGG